MSEKIFHQATEIVHAGREPENSGALASDIAPSTTFVRDAGAHVYSRYSNPTRDRLEKAIAILEGGGESAAFASGMAAVTAVFELLEPDQHVIVGEDAYHGVARLLENHFTRRKIAVDYVDTRDLDAVEAARRSETALLWFETPSNPQLRISDLAALGAWARKHGIVSACDSTLAPPVLQQPLMYGIDIVMHSATKFLGGHSDLLGGFVTTNEPGLANRIRDWQGNSGAVPSAFDAWLLLRSLSTLDVRVRQQCESAQKIAEWLAEHPAIETVFYPGLPQHPGHDLARRQMRGSGGLLSVLIRGDEALARRIAASTRLFTEATSLGGVESLIEHRASVEGAQRRSPENLLRLSIGLEHADDLIDDLDQALDQHAT